MNIIRGLNECATLFQWVRSAISSLRTLWNGTENDKLQGDVLQLQSDLKCLGDTLQAVYILIDRAEWRIHDQCVADLLPKVKEAVYDAEDLLDEFTWHAHKVSVEGNATQLAPFIDFFNSVTQGSFNKVTDIQERLNNLSNQLKEMGFHQATPRFDESLRPETTSFPTEAKIFGRAKETKELIRLIGVPSNNRKRTGSAVVAPTNKRRYSSRHKTARTGDGSSTSNQVYTTFNNNEGTMESIPVLPIVGIGGVGKTTLAQNICSDPQVKSHYELIIWICVSDDFDVKRLTKEAIEQASGKAPMNDNLNSLQTDLANSLNKRRFLIFLDDMWDENKERWKGFYAPFKNVHEGSMMLVTTRSEKVADIVRTTDSFPIEGLKDDDFWEFFKLCVFGSDSSNMDPELERIGREILPKLRGSPLAAKTLGRLLGISRDTTHWNNILNSELWQHDQEGTEILPALRLSYMYLPFHLKRCFSFCAVYPKDHNFEKDSLAEMWVAEGFVVPKGNIPLQDIGSQYFLELVNRSFFQKFRGAYVIHDLMHDMAQLVSKDECFIVKNSSDLEKVPQSVRHLSILPITNVKHYNLLSLGKCTKLRTLLCNKPLSSRAMDCWFEKLLCLRVIFCGSTKKLPDSIGNLKHLRYLAISRTCHFRSLPSSFCSLYNLQIFYARKCKLESLPRGISKLINLQKFKSNNLEMEVDAAELKEQLSFIENFYQHRELTIYNLGAISKARAAESELRKKEYLNSLTLRWSSLRCPEHNETEVLQALQPPTNIKSVRIEGYPGEYLPSWFRGCDGPEDMPFSELRAATVDNNNNSGAGTIFPLLTEVSIKGCQNLLSLEQFLHPTTSVPAIREIVIADCASVKSIPIEWSPSVEEISVSNCPKMTHLSAPSAKKLVLKEIFGFNIDCSSLTFLHIYSSQLPSIELEKWSLPVLARLHIGFCECLKFIRESERISTGLSLGLARARGSTAKFPLLTHLNIECCRKLESIDDLLTHECLPTIESINIGSCDLLSLPTKRFESFPFLKNLEIGICPRLYWQSAMVLPPSLRKLILRSCGDFSAWSPRCCLENLTSLESLTMDLCKGIVCIPGDLWSSNLKSLRRLKITDCPDLVSIGGLEAIANINTVYIRGCPKLMEIEQPRGNPWIDGPDQEFESIFSRMEGPEEISSMEAPTVGRSQELKAGGAGDPSSSLLPTLPSSMASKILGEAVGGLHDILSSRRGWSPPSPTARSATPTSPLDGTILKLPGKLDSLLRHGCALPKGVADEIPLTKLDLEKIIAISSNLQEDDHAMMVRCWRKEVRELSYDMEDFMDQYDHGAAMTCARSIRGQEITRWRKSKRSLPWIREKLRQRLWMANKIREFSERAQEALERHRLYNLDAIAGSASFSCADDACPTSWNGTPCGEDKAYVGIDAAMEDLEELLMMTHDQGHQKLQVVSIVGFGGIGKTTLAMELYRKLGQQFECRAFVRTSQKPDMRRIFISMLSQVRPHQLTDNWTVPGLISTIRTHLQDKRYLIIVEDLWTTSTWDIVKHALPESNCCSRILTTTEIEDLALQSCDHDPKYVYKMQPLGEDNSRKLYFSSVFGPQDECPPELRQISHDIIRKCGGLPLAIVTVASILSNQPGKQDRWDYVSKAIGYSLLTNPTWEGMKQIFDLSYNNLPQHLKACILYTGLYEEDIVIWKDDLVNQWIAEGFIQATEGQDKKEIARSFFDRLINGKLILPVDVNRNGEVLSCTIHHMVLNLVVRCKSIEENFVTAIRHSEATTTLADKVRRLSLQFGNAEDAITPPNMRLSQVRTLAFWGVFKCLPSVVQFRLLQVLILHFWGDKDSISFDITAISELFRLRYLKVASNVTLELHTQMQGLKSLETLTIDARVSSVPSDIFHLPGLLHLSLPAETNLPSGIDHMTSLRTLGCFDITSNSIENVDSLSKLTNLGDLQLTCSTVHAENLNSKMQYVLNTILGRLSYLKSLTVVPRASSSSYAKSIDDTGLTGMTISGGFSSLSSAPALLRSLEVSPQICIFFYTPKWIGQLRELCILKFGVRRIDRDGVDVLSGLPALSVLTLYVQTKPAARIIIERTGFPVIKYFRFKCCDALLEFEEGAMPNLRKLKLAFNASNADQHSTIPVGIEYLSELKEVSAKIGGVGPEESHGRAAELAFRDAIKVDARFQRVNVQCVKKIIECKDDQSSVTTVEIEQPRGNPWN